MKNMRKMMAVALSAAMVLALGACGGESTSSNSSTQSGSTSTDGKVYNIGICQQLEHPALDAATEGFEAALKDKLGDNVKFLICRTHRTSRQTLLQSQTISYLAMLISSLPMQHLHYRHVPLQQLIFRFLEHP